MSHEIPDHYRGKSLLAACQRLRGYESFLEMGADVLSVRISNGHMDLVMSEYERSVRNLVANCRRNLRSSQSHPTRYLIAVPNERVRQAARRLLQKHFAPQIARKFAIALLSSIERSLNMSRQAHQKRPASR